MTSVRMEGTLPLEHTAAKCENGVKKGNCQCKQGHGEAHNCVKLEKTHNRHCCQHIAEQQSARVAHENLRGVEVKGNEAETGPRERGEDD